MKFGLSDKTIEAIQDVLSQHRQIGRAVIYGSRAKGNYRTGSDIDLTLVAAKGETLDLNLLIKIDDALDNLLLPYSFDLSILAGIDNPALVEHIQRVGQLFYQR
ncbi:nucleotidyltransferase domain-containing protein [Endozoicomonas sp. 8E]|uniref:nucleotidyltransferase domain-containing protein n=1 Tax=Endozoicomonas sp. 8E TaxID=3035692 RepID=UPI00293938FF|nr:nucleotidyltransferase domain-containing protein [Endozoicomonas sp. 8E]WOG29992.1 nucleotidyltransferase domain-containing protein [Endozoicomonas sp. 8E]